MHSTATTADQDLTAIRARGRIGLDVENVAGITRRRRVHESGSLRVRFPGAPAAELEAVTVNTGGGMTGGDAFDIEVSVGENARLVVTTTAAEKIYRSLGPPVTVNVKIRVAAGGTLAWLPQETILFDRASLHRRIEVDLADDAQLVLVEPLIFGRTGMGEAVRNGALHDTWRVRQGGRLIYAEGTQLSGRHRTIARRERGCERRRGDRDGAGRSRRRDPDRRRSRHRRRIPRRGRRFSLERPDGVAILRARRRRLAPRHHLRARNDTNRAAAAKLDQLTSLEFVHVSHAPGKGQAA